MTNRISLSYVCLGNICRSPIAHVVTEAQLAEAALPFEVHVTSSGTGGWHTGKPMDARAAEALHRRGYDPTRHRARHFTRDEFALNDLLFTMDAANQADVVDLAPSVADQRRVHRFRSFDPEAGEDLDLPDPYYGGPEGFGSTLDIVERTVRTLLDQLPALVEQPAT